MEKAVDKILETIKAGKKVTVYSDYDADGIPGAVVLTDFFKKIEYENYSVYIPHRNREGFGLNKKAIEKIKLNDTKNKNINDLFWLRFLVNLKIENKYLDKLDTQGLKISNKRDDV